MATITITNPKTKAVEPTTGELGHCRACPAEIVWVRNANGNMQPYDREPNADGTNHPHHASCPSAHLFRRKAKA